MYNAILSIVIPTADRADILYETLRNLKKEVEQSGEKIRVLVIDNASNPPVHVERCERLGVELKRFDDRGDVGDSIIRAIQQADSEYVWVFGDDDLMCLGALSIVLRLLKDRTIDVLYMNRYIAPLLMNRIEGTEHDVEVGDVQYMKGFEAAIKFTHHPGFISSLVFKKSIMTAPEQCEALFPGYGFMAELYRKSSQANFAYLTKPQVIQRRSHALWKTSWPRFWMVTLPRLAEWLEDEYEIVGIKKSMSLETNRIALRTLLSARANGYRSDDKFWTESYKYLTPLGKAASLFFRYFIPVKIARISYRAMFYVKSTISELRA